MPDLRWRREMLRPYYLLITDYLRLTNYLLLRYLLIRARDSAGSAGSKGETA